MSETSSPQSGPSYRAVEIGTAVLFLIFGGIVIAGSLSAGMGWGPDGPRAGFFPFYVGVTIIIATIVNLVHAFQLDRDTLFADWSQLQQVLSVIIPTTVYVFLVPYLGLYVASFLLIALFMRWLGHYGWPLVAGVSIGVPVLAFFMFEKWFLVPLPKGPLEDWLGL
jgi:putative tricarboxylic transport membrane protein